MRWCDLVLWVYRRYGWRDGAYFVWRTIIALWEDHVLLPLGKWLKGR